MTKTHKQVHSLVVAREDQKSLTGIIDQFKSAQLVLSQLGIYTIIYIDPKRGTLKRRAKRLVEKVFPSTTPSGSRIFVQYLVEEPIEEVERKLKKAIGSK